MMMKKALLILVALALVPMAAQAATINITTGGTAMTTTGITGFQTLGNDMVGMKVVVEIERNGTTQSFERTWGSLDSGNYGVEFSSAGSDDFGLSLFGWADTYDSSWDFDFKYNGNNVWKLLSLTLDGTPGRTVFDRTFDNHDGTPGSASGRDFSDFDWDGTIDAVYLNPVGIGATAPVGDIYAGFKATFRNGLPEAKNYSFRLDTDNATTDIVPAVPEPTSMLLLGTGLVGLAGAARRRLRK